MISEKYKLGRKKKRARKISSQLKKINVKRNTCAIYYINIAGSLTLIIIVCLIITDVWSKKLHLIFTSVHITSSM